MLRAGLLAALLLTSASAFAQQRGFEVMPPENASGEGRVALVIGNARYRSAPLQNPSRDAGLVAASLREVGFDVDERHDLDRRGMLKAIRRFGDRLKAKGGVGLFYFAGHGMQVDGRSYLLPVRADIRVEADVELEAIDATRVLARMDEANNRLNLVVLDACRNNPVARGVRSREAGLAFLNAPSGTLISYATSPGQTASDGDWRHSPYSLAFAEELKQPGLRVEDVFKRVRTRVREATRGEQVPWESSSLEGNFYFVPRGAGVVSSPPAASRPAPGPPPGPPEAETRREGWQAQVHEHRALEEDPPQDAAGDLRPGPDREMEGPPDTTALEAELALYRTTEFWLDTAGWLVWVAPAVGILLVLAVAGAGGASIAGGSTDLATTGGTVFGLVAALSITACAGCGVAGVYIVDAVITSMGDRVESEIRAKDPSWISPYAGELPPPEPRALAMFY